MYRLISNIIKTRVRNIYINIFNNNNIKDKSKCYHIKNYRYTNYATNMTNESKEYCTTYNLINISKFSVIFNLDTNEMQL